MGKRAHHPNGGIATRPATCAHEARSFDEDCPILQREGCRECAIGMLLITIVNLQAWVSQLASENTRAGGREDPHGRGDGNE
jgi:hypothetical protein